MLPKIFILDDNGGNINRVKSILDNEENFNRALNAFISTRTDDKEKVILRNITFNDLPVPEIVNVDNSDDATFNTCLENFRCTISLESDQPSILYLDYALRSFSETEGDDAIAAETLKRYCPSKLRTWALASIFSRGASSELLKDYQPYRGQEVIGGFSERDCPIIFKGLLHWMTQNQVSSNSMYECFVDELLTFSHEETDNTDFVLNWLAKYIPFASYLEGNYSDALRRTIHDLGLGRAVYLDAAFILALVALRSALDNNNIDEEINFKDHGNTLNLYYRNEKNEDTPVFLAQQSIGPDDALDKTYREHTLKVFGQAFSRLFICDPDSTDPCCNTPDIKGKSSVVSINLSRNEFSIDLCFKYRAIAITLQNWVYYVARERIKNIKINAKSVFPNNEPDLHYTSKLLFSFRDLMSLCHVHNDLSALGSAVVMSIKHNNDTQTRIAFRG